MPWTEPISHRCNTLTVLPSQEMSIIASRSVIIWDVLRNELLFGTDGLPLGFLSAPSRFQQAYFWFSPDLWFGQKGIKSLRKKIFLFSLVLTCTLLAIFSGPSSAVLMIPPWFTDWSGGGATFHILGDKSTIWPEELRNGEPCGRAKSEDGPLALLGLINDTCATSSTAAIAQALQGWMFGDIYYPIDVTDGLVRRKITINLYGPDGPDTWAITPQLAPCVVSRVLSDNWRFKAIRSRMTDSVFSGYAKYRYRKREATVAVMKSQVPVVRVSCSMHNFVSDSAEPLDPMVSSPVPMRVLEVK